MPKKRPLRIEEHKEQQRNSKTSISRELFESVLQPTTSIDIGATNEQLLKLIYEKQNDTTRELITLQELSDADVGDDEVTKQQEVVYEKMIDCMGEVLGGVSFLIGKEPLVIGADTHRSIKNGVKRKRMIFEPANIPNINSGGVSIYDLLMEELSIEQISRFLITASRSSVDPNTGLVDATYTNLFGYIFSNLLVQDLSMLDSEQVPPSIENWVKNSQLFYSYVSGFLASEVNLDSEIFGFMEDDHTKYFFTRLAYIELNRGIEIDKLFANIDDLYPHQHHHAMKGILEGYRLAYGENYDPVYSFSSERDPIFDKLPIDQELLDDVHEFLSLQVSNSKSVIKEEITKRRRGIFIDLEEMLFAKRMGARSVFIKPPVESDDRIFVQLLFENGLKTNFPFDLTLEYSSENEDTGLDSTSVQFMNILIMSLLLEAHEASDGRRSKSVFKTSSEKLMTILAKKKGVDLKWFELLDSKLDYIDPKTGEIISALKNWSCPRVITTDSKFQRRPQLTWWREIDRIPGLRDSIYWGQEAQVDYYEGPYQELRSGENDRIFHPQGRNIGSDIGKSYKPPETYDEFVEGLSDPWEEQDPTGILVYEEAARISKILALETIVLNQV